MQNQCSTPAYKNEAHVAGTLAKDPVTRITATGKHVTNLTVITRHEQYSEFHKVVLWEQNAEKVAKLVKGDFVKIVGRLATRTWDDKASGQKKFITEVVAFSVSIPAEESAPPLTPDQVRGPDSDKGGTQIARAILAPSTAVTPNLHGLEVSDDDIPF